MSDLKLLDGVKVVDMSAFVAAPMAAEILAEYGADVVRIEPLTGDGIRGSGMTQNIYNGDAPLYDAINGNKRHIAVNTRTAEGMGVLWKLLETADIFICHMREKDMVKLGIDWDTLHAKFPALIYANTTGYGSTGPLASRGGFDMIAYATRTGLTTDVVPEGAHPYMPYQAQGDIPTGLYLSIGIMAAYINRLRTGLGDQVSCSLYGSGMMSAMVPILSGQKPYNNLWPKGRENVLPFSCMYRGSDDRWIMVAGLQWHKDWPRFVARLGLDPELVTKYPDYMTALAKSNEIIPMLDELFATKTVQEWSDILTEEDIPNDICLKFSEVADDPAVLTGNLMKEVEMPSGEVIKMPRTPVYFREAGAPDPVVAPTVGCRHRSRAEGMRLYRRGDQEDGRGKGRRPGRHLGSLHVRHQVLTASRNDFAGRTEHRARPAHRNKKRNQLRRSQNAASTFVFRRRRGRLQVPVPPAAAPSRTPKW